MSILSGTLVACDRKPTQISYLHIYLLIYWKAIGQTLHNTAKVMLALEPTSLGTGGARGVNMLLCWPFGFIISYQLPSFSRKKVDRD